MATQYPCLENLMDRGAWWAIAHRVTESDTTEKALHTDGLDVLLSSSIPEGIGHIFNMVGKYKSRWSRMVTELHLHFQTVILLHITNDWRVSSWVYFACIVLLLGIEWFLRKWNGGI